ncbi:MAG: hypothetical protein JJ863_25355 [Deltaproteobacteria bacterium]|nr:hypothetical protein [Deltaproteobacteria bacterium]
MRWSLSVGLLSALVSSSAALAQPVALVDDTAATELAAPALTPQSLGVGSGFGGMIGERPGGDPIELAFDSDAAGGLQIDLRNGVCMGANDYAVVYLDTRAGGFATTTPLTDISDPGRAAVSGRGTDGAMADVTFPVAPVAFEADFAIAINNVTGTPSANLFELVGGASLTYVATLVATEVVVGCSHLRLEGSIADLGLESGDSFRWAATLLNATNGFRSNEVQGAFATTPANPGIGPIVLGGYNEFTSVPAVRINEVDSDQPSTDTAEFVELLGGPDTRMDGVAVVFFNGSDDASYLALDLDGTSLNATGYLVLGNAGVGAATVIFTDNTLQNGADGVGVYLADATDFPEDTPVTGDGLVDGLVYVTSDADDIGLSSVLLAAGEVAFDEDADGDAAMVSGSRCPNGSGGPGEAGVFRTTPPTPGAANDCIRCGDGFMEGSEDCDDGPANGTAGSCCTASCTVDPSCSADMFVPEADMFVAEDMFTPEDMFVAEDMFVPGDMGHEDMAVPEMDLGTPAMDLGTPDGGASGRDAGFDPPFEDDDGCSCRTPGAGRSPWPALALVFGLALAIRRRR